MILGQALVGQQHIFELWEVGQFEALEDSAQYVINTFLAAPIPNAGHFPASAYRSVWYCLLVLSKAVYSFILMSI